MEVGEIRGSGSHSRDRSLPSRGKGDSRPRRRQGSRGGGVGAGGEGWAAEGGGGYLPYFLRILLGQVGALLCIFHPSPQARVIQTKSTQRLSFSLTIATLLTSASWTLYGFRLRDPYIMVSSAARGGRCARWEINSPHRSPWDFRCPTSQASSPASFASGSSGSTLRSKTGTINSCRPEAVHLNTGRLPASLMPKRFEPTCFNCSC